MTKQQHIITKQIQKHDIEVNWLKAINFIPEKGRLIIYDIEVDAEGNTLELPENRTTPYTHERFKIGDGIHNVNDLPFSDGVGKTTENGGEIFNDYTNNKALSNYSSAHGYSNIAGSKAYTITAFDVEAKTLVCGNVQSLIGVELNDIYSIYFPVSNVLSMNQDFAGKVVGISDNIITVDNLPSEMIEYIEGGNYYIWFPEKPTVNGDMSIGDTAVANGWQTKANAVTATSFGYNTIAAGKYSIAEGKSTKAGFASHSGGEATEALGKWSLSFGRENKSLGDYSTTFGIKNNAIEYASLAIGEQTTASGKRSTTLGYLTAATGENSLSGGKQTQAIGVNSLAFGDRSIAKGENSISLGIAAEANGAASLALGYYVKANGPRSLAVGDTTQATAYRSFAEGFKTQATGLQSHASGSETLAYANDSYAGGLGTIAGAAAQMSIGKYNKQDSNALFIIGNGTKESRNNAFTVNTDGTATIQTSGTNDNNVVNYKQLKDYVSANGGDVNLEDSNKSIRIHNKEIGDSCDWSDPSITIGNNFLSWCHGYTDPEQQLYMSYNLVELKDDVSTLCSQLTPGELEFTTSYSEVKLNSSGVVYNGSMAYWRDIINSGSGGGSNPYENLDSKVYINIAKDDYCSSTYDESPEIKLQNRYNGYSYNQQLSIQPEEIYSRHGDMYEYRLNYNGIMIHNGKNDCGMDNLRVLNINLNGISYDGYYYEGCNSQVRYSKTVTWKELLSSGSGGGGTTVINPYENSDSRVYIDLGRDSGYEPCSGDYISSIPPKILLQGNKNYNDSYTQQLLIQLDRIYSNDRNYSEYELSYNGMMIRDGMNDCGYNNYRKLNITLNGIEYTGYKDSDYTSESYTKTMTWERLFAAIEKIENM